MEQRNLRPEGRMEALGRRPAMKSAKEEARDVITRLPDSATWDELMYELYVRRKIAEGVEAADEGRIVSHEDVRSAFAPIGL
jgi:predicted transcriptional regulator